MFILGTVIMLAAGSSFANGNDISKIVQQHFTKQFAGATHVQWEDKTTYYSAAFELNERFYTALYSTDGEMIAISRNVLSTELPGRLQSILKNNFGSYWVTDLVKYRIGEETRYYVTLENAATKNLLENIGDEEWSVLKTTDK